MPQTDVKDLNRIGDLLNTASLFIHRSNTTWWHHPRTGKRLKRNFGEMIALCHAELSEALEADRKHLMDTHLPHRCGVEVELADALIRILDIGAALGMDLGSAVAEKMAYNQTRPDHKPANRRKKGGLKY
jgi:NTP pyrophosphatase (non-canonical NTP hydrolase)